MAIVITVNAMYHQVPPNYSKNDFESVKSELVWKLENWNGGRLDRLQVMMLLMIMMMMMMMLLMMMMMMMMTAVNILREMQLWTDRIELDCYSVHGILSR